MNAPDRDIASRADIVRLVDGFYARVRADEILGSIFDGIARTDWGRHLPKMYDFWDAVLFGASGFQGNPLAVHRELATRVPLGEREFARWLALFHESVDALFSGPRAEDTKVRASRIAAVMRHHILADAESAAAV
jgi:hemoglobin